MPLNRPKFATYQHTQNTMLISTWWHLLKQEEEGGREMQRLFLSVY